MNERHHRRVIAAQHGGPGVLQVIEEPMPTPAAGQVRVRTEAAGVSAMDLMVRSAAFPGFPKVPFTPGVDVLGTVDDVGDDVSGVEPGQRVAALLGDKGGYAEYVCVPESLAVPVPPDVDAAEGICLVANYLTASTMLHRAADVRAGERVLVHGAAGGVGTALLELGRLTGLEMFATASASNHQFVESMGAIPIDYRTEDFVDRIRTLTGDGVDVVFDPIGGARQLWRSYRTLRRGGRLIWFGVAATSRSGLRVIPASLAMRLLLSLYPNGRKAPMPPDARTPNTWYRDTLEMLFDHLQAGKIEPVIAARLPLTEAARAHELLERGGHRGKFVLIAG